MAKILTTKGSVAELEDLIWKANKNVYLISFNFIISNDFILRLKQVSNRGVIIHIVYGKNIRQDSLEQLLDIETIKIYRYPNLHAKLFLNEQKCIIGSMNFSEASEHNNTELGVLLTQKEDIDAYNDSLNHCLDIINGADLEFECVNKSKNHEYHSYKNTKHKEEILLGYCIRTGQRISLNHERPFCYEAFQEWNEWQNDNYAEKFCHFSGERSRGEISKANPILNKHWKSYQNAI